VNFKYKDSKPAKVTLILKFNYPIKPGTWLTIITFTYTKTTLKYSYSWFFRSKYKKCFWKNVRKIWVL